MTIEELRAKLPSDSFRVDVNEVDLVVISTKFTVNAFVRRVTLTQEELDQGFDYIMREICSQMFHAGYNSKL